VDILAESTARVVCCSALGLGRGQRSGVYERAELSFASALQHRVRALILHCLARGVLACWTDGHETPDKGDGKDVPTLASQYAPSHVSLDADACWILV
jgi:hypothetical protein